MTFARRHWYVAALSSEITTQPLARTILGEHVVLYRRASGTPVALADRCPHRRYPLSLGRLAGDLLVCGYHGFTFDGGGHCVAVPGQDAIPSRADVRTYPVVEQGAWTWIWMGDPDQPEEARLPCTPWLCEGDWAVNCGMLPLAARYLLLVDNLLDLSHETYLHGGYIGTPEVAATPIQTEVDDSTSVVRVSRHMHDAECPPFYANSTGIKGRIDRWQDIEYSPPGYYLLHSRIAPAGAPVRPDGGDPDAFHLKISYGITPSTEHSTYDFWAVSRDFALDDDKVHTFLGTLNEQVVAQDVEALGVLEQRIATDPDPFELNIKIDRGGLAARRVIERLVAAEGQA